MNARATEYYLAYRAAMGDVGLTPSANAVALEAATRGVSPFASAGSLVSQSAGRGGGLTFGMGRAFFQGSPYAAVVPYGTAHGLAKVGSRQMIFNPAIYATRPNLDAVEEMSDPWLSLGRILGRSAEYGMTVNPVSATGRLQREVRLWERLHLQPLEGHRGVRNLGAITGKRRRGILYMQDVGERADELAGLQKTLLSAIFGGKEGQKNIDPLLAMEAWRNKYMEHLEKVLRMAGPAGHPMNIAGIKDASFRILHVNTPGGAVDRQSIMTVNMGDPEATRLFALERDFATEDRHTAAKIATLPFQGKKGGIGLFRLHPLVATSEYAADLDIMKGLVPKGLGKFGTVIRGKTAYLYGKGAGTFARYAGLYGGAVSVMSTGAGAKLAQGVGLATSFSQIELRGVRGMYAGDFGKTELSSELLNIPGLREAMLSPERQAFELSKPYRMQQRTIAKIFGKRSIQEKRIHVGAKLHRVEFNETGMKLLFQERGSKFGIGTPSAIPGLKSSLTSGGSWGSAEMLSYGNKFGVAANAREAILGHYAEAIIGGTNRTKQMRKQRLGVLAEMAGMDLGHSAEAGYYLHGGAGRYAGISIDRLLSEDFVRELASKTGKSADKLRIGKYSPSRAELIENMVRGGGMDIASARRIAGELHGTVESLVLQGQPLSIRPHLFTNPRTRPKVRMGEARSFHSFLSDMSMYAKGDARDIAGRAAEIVGGNISKKEDFLGRVLAGVYAPYYEGMGQLDASKLPGASSISLGAVQNADLYQRITKHRTETGNISEDLLSEMMERFGISKGSVGAMVDLGGTKINYPFPGAEMSSAAAGKVFVPNPHELFGILKRESLTGFAAADIRLPMYPFEPGVAAGERGGIRASAAVINAMVEMLNPEATAGTLSKRADLMARGVAEHIVGGRKAMSRAAVGGFTTSRYVQELSSRSGLVAEVTESGLLRMSSHGPKMARQRLSQYVAGGLSFESLNEAEQILAKTIYRRPGEGAEKVFAWAGRHPMQTAQQASYAVRLRVLSDKQAMERFGKKVIHKDTLWTSLLFQHLSQGDTDTDTVRLMLLNNTPGLGFQAQQTLLASVNRMQQEEARGVQRALRESLSNGPGEVFPKGLGGKIPTADELINLQTRGGAQRIKENKLVGMVHAWSTEQMRALASSTGQSNIYGSSRKLQEIAVETGMGVFEDAANRSGYRARYRLADSEVYLRNIYGFLKKRGAVEDKALSMIGVANWAGENYGARGTTSWLKKQEEMVGHLRGLSEAIPGTDLAPYLGLTPGASKHIAGGKVTDERLRELAEMVMNVSAYRSRLKKEGFSENIYTAISRGEGPQDVAQRILGRVMGARVSGALPSVSDVSPEAVKAMGKTRVVRGMGARSVAQTAAANIAAEKAGFSETFASGAQRAGTFIEDAYKSIGVSHAWTGLIAAGGVAGLLAAGPGLKNLISPVSQSSAPVLEGPPIPPSPMLGRPSDGARPSALAPRVNVARIQRTSTERTHFPEEEERMMESPMDIYAPPRRVPLVQGGIRTAPSFPR